MKEVGLYEAKATLSALITELEATGEKVMLTRHGKIVAEIHPHRDSPAPTRGLLKSPGFSIAPDFNDTEVGFEDFFGDAAVRTRVAEDSPSYRTKKGS